MKFGHKIEANLRHGHGKVLIDGNEIFCRSIKVESKVGGISFVTLEIIAEDVAYRDDWSATPAFLDSSGPGAGNTQGSQFPTPTCAPVGTV